MFEYLLFDLDGTLTDPGEGITKSIQYSLSAMGIEEQNLSKLTAFIGPPLRESFVNFYGVTEEEAEQCVEKYRERYTPIGIFENKIYFGIEDMLKECKAAGKKLAVASSKPTIMVNRVLEHFKIIQYFDIIVGSELNGIRSKKEEVVEEVLRLIQLDNSKEVSKEQIVMIGDRKFDIEGAKAFHLASVGVRYGYEEEGELEAAGADYLVDTVAELKDILMG